ncbi:uncharacterized protein LOC144167463 [Haemaphysalis longicornis]
MDVVEAPLPAEGEEPPQAEESAPVEAGVPEEGDVAAGEVTLYVEVLATPKGEKAPTAERNASEDVAVTAETGAPSAESTALVEGAAVAGREESPYGKTEAREEAPPPDKPEAPPAEMPASIEGEGALGAESKASEEAVAMMKIAPSAKSMAHVEAPAPAESIRIPQDETAPEQTAAPESTEAAPAEARAPVEASAEGEAPPGAETKTPEGKAEKLTEPPVEAIAPLEVPASSESDRVPVAETNIQQGVPTQTVLAPQEMLALGITVWEIAPGIDTKATKQAAVGAENVTQLDVATAVDERPAVAESKRVYQAEAKTPEGAAAAAESPTMVGVSPLVDTKRTSSKDMMPGTTNFLFRSVPQGLLSARTSADTFFVQAIRTTSHQDLPQATTEKKTVFIDAALPCDGPLSETVIEPLEYLFVATNTENMGRYSQCNLRETSQVVRGVDDVGVAKPTEEIETKFEELRDSQGSSRNWKFTFNCARGKADLSNTAPGRIKRTVDLAQSMASNKKQ